MGFRLLSPPEEVVSETPTTPALPPGFRLVVPPEREKGLKAVVRSAGEVITSAPAALRRIGRGIAETLTAPPPPTEPPLQIAGITEFPISPSPTTAPTLVSAPPELGSLVSPLRPLSVVEQLDVPAETLPPPPGPPIPEAEATRRLQRAGSVVVPPRTLKESLTETRPAAAFFAGAGQSIEGSLLRSLGVGRTQLDDALSELGQNPTRLERVISSTIEVASPAAVASFLLTRSPTAGRVMATGIGRLLGPSRASQLVSRAAQASTEGATSFFGFEVAQDLSEQAAEIAEGTREAVDLTQTSARVRAGTVLGAALGPTGVIPGRLARVGTELGVFASVPAALAGRVPTVEDLIDAGLLLGALKGAGRLRRDLAERLGHRITLSVAEAALGTPKAERTPEAQRIVETIPANLKDLMAADAFATIQEGLRRGGGEEPVEPPLPTVAERVGERAERLDRLRTTAEIASARGVEAPEVPRDRFLALGHRGQGAWLVVDLTTGEIAARRPGQKAAEQEAERRNRALVEAVVPVEAGPRRLRPEGRPSPEALEADAARLAAEQRGRRAFIGREGAPPIPPAERIVERPEFETVRRAVEREPVPLPLERAALPPAPVEAAPPPTEPSPPSERRPVRPRPTPERVELLPEEQETLGRVKADLEAAEPGRRLFQEGEFVGTQPSTFPQAIFSAVGLTPSRLAANRLLKAIDRLSEGSVKGPLDKQLLDYVRRNPTTIPREPAPEEPTSATVERAHEAATGIETAPMSAPPTRFERTLEDKQARLEETSPSRQEPEEALLGPGAMAPGESRSVQPLTTGMKNAVKDAERQARGEAPLFSTGRLSNQAAWDQALRLIDDNPSVQAELLDTLELSPRAVTPVENALLLHRSIDLLNERNSVARQLFDAVEQGFTDRAEVLRQQAERMSDDLVRLEVVGRAVGTKAGQSLQARKMMADQDYSLAAMETRKRIAKGGAPLTPLERATVARLQQRIQALQRALDERTTVGVTTASQTAATQTVRDIVDRITREPADQAPRDLGAERQTLIAAMREAAADTDSPADLRRYVQRLAESFVREGIATRDPLIDAVHEVLQTMFPAMTRREAMDLISGFGDFRPLDPDAVKVTLRDLKGQMQQIAKLETLLAQAGPVPKTGPERRTPSAEERRLIKLVEEYKRRYGVAGGDPQTHLKSALEAVKTRLRHDIADLDYQIATRKKLIPVRSPIPSDAEADALRARREALRAQFDEVFGKPERTPEQRVKLAMAAVERSIADLDARLRTGELAPRSRLSQTPVTPELEAARARRDALRDQLQELREASPELGLARLKARLSNQIADLQDRVARGDFSPRVRREVAPDAAATTLQRELDRVKREFNDGLVRDRLSRRTVAQKVLAGVGEALNVPRILMTSFDLSAVLRQGGFVVFGHPLRGLKIFPAMLRALGSREAEHAIQEEILTRPTAPLARRAGLFLSDQQQTLSQMEEVYMSRWAQKIPGIGASQRAFTTFLNRLRADSFDAMVRTLGEKGTVSLEQAKALANFINVATGRGSTPAMAAGAVGLNTVFFAPRYLVSRFQLLAGQPFVRGTGVRGEIAKEYARFLAGMAVFYALASAAGATIGGNPRSSDFGKIRVGATRVDPMTGLLQILVLLARLATGQTTTLKGKTLPLRGPRIPFGRDDAFDVIARFVRTKFSPSVSLAVDLLAGRTVVGRPIVIAEHVAPLAGQDIYDALQKQEVPTATVLALLTILGMGLQTYQRPGAALRRPFLTEAEPVEGRFRLVEPATP